MSQSERNEWIEAAKEKVIFDEGQTDKAVKEIMYLYDEAAFEVENCINALFSKYAKENNLTSAEANRLLSGEEYSVWRKSIDKYFAETVVDAADSKTLLELNTLAMKSRISREEKLLADVYRHMAELANDTSTDLTALLGDITRTSYYRSCFNLQKGIGIGFEVGKISDRVIDGILQYPWAKKKFSKTVWDNVDTISALTKRVITKGFISGSGCQKMVKEINDVMGKGKEAAERVVRTECKYFANRGELQGYKENGITQYVFMGGSEGSVHCDCAFYNEKIIDVDKAEAGVNFPPMHPNCLCTVRAHFELSVFGDRSNVTPLDKNIKYQEWKKRFIDNPAPPAKVALSDNEESALNSYISSDSYKLNEKLRSGVKLSASDKKLIKSLDSALDRMPEFTGTVYRSVSSFGVDTEAFVKSHIPGEVRNFEQYISTGSTVYDSSFPVQYVIKSKRGKDIRAYNPNESEILFKRDALFNIIKVEDNTIFMEEM